MYLNKSKSSWVDKSFIFQSRFKTVLNPCTEHLKLFENRVNFVFVKIFVNEFKTKQNVWM